MKSASFLTSMGKLSFEQNLMIKSDEDDTEMPVEVPFEETRVLRMIL